MLSAGAFNALLKTLEEPPSYVIFILATTEAHKIPMTILSRCQRYDFHRISIDTIAGRLQELMEKEQRGSGRKSNSLCGKGRRRFHARRTEPSGSVHCLLSGAELTYDQVLDVLGAVDTEVFSRFLRKVLAAGCHSCIQHSGRACGAGRELGQFVRDFTWYLRNLLLVKTSEDAEEVLDVSSENLKASQGRE